MADGKQVSLGYASGALGHGPRRERPVLRWMVFLSMPLAWGIPLAILGVVVAAGTGLMFMPMGLGGLFVPLPTLFVVYALYRMRVRSRRVNGQMIVGYLEMAVRLNLPLVRFLKSAERSERGRRRRQLGAVRQSLQSGLPVAAALESARDVPEEWVMEVAAKESVGQLPAALETLSREGRGGNVEGRRGDERVLYRFYPFLLLYAIVVMGGAYFIFVVPRFREIFRDFRTPLPASTEWLIWIASMVTDYWPVAALMALGFAMALVLVASLLLTRTFIPSMPTPRFLRMWSWLAWRLPVLRGMERDKGMAETCTLLARAMEDGVPLEAALERAMILPVNEGFRRQVERFREALLRGETAGNAARHAGLPGLMAGLLAPMGGRGADVAGGSVFEFLARYHGQRFSRTMMLLRAAAEPMLVLIFGLLVAGMVVALIQPLAVLTNHVAGEVPGGYL